MPSGPKRIMPQGSRSSTLHVPDSPDLLQQIWAKFQQGWLGSSQNMHSDIIRAGWLECGDRATIKAIVSAPAQDGLTIHLPPSWNRQEKLQFNLECKTNSETFFQRPHRWQQSVPSAHTSNILTQTFKCFQLHLKRVTVECRLCNRVIMQGLQIIWAMLMMSCKDCP